MPAQKGRKLQDKGGKAAPPAVRPQSYNCDHPNHLPTDPATCPCGSICPCSPSCWCQSTHAPSTTGSTSGTSGSTATSTTGSTTAGATDGATTGSTSTASTSGTTAGTTSGTNAGSDAGSDAGGTNATTATAGSTGDSTGGTTGGTTSTTGGSSGWTPTGTVDMGGVPEMGYVSGTNVNATFTLNLIKAANATYTDVFVKSVDLKMGGEVDSSFNWPINQALTSSDNVHSSCAIPARFASARFKDGATIALNATFHYQLSKTGSPDQNLDFALPTRNVVAYNKGLTLRTELYVNCYLQNYQWEAPPGTPNSYDWDSQKAIPDARSSLVAMNHTTPSNPSLSRDGTLGGLNTMTAFFAFTHGETDGIYPSYGAAADKHAGTSDKMRFSQGATSDIGKAVWGDGVTWAVRKTATPKAIPNPNMVVLYACSGFDSGVLPPLRAFGLLGPNDFTTPMPPSMVDRAIAGFNDVVDNRLYQRLNSSDPHLSEHAKLVYENLLKGQTLGKAVDAANDKYHPAHTSCSFSSIQQTPMDMLARGDVNARLISVYTGDGSLPTRPLSEQQPGWYPYRWYKVNP